MAVLRSSNRGLVGRAPSIKQATLGGESELWMGNGWCMGTLCGYSRGGGGVSPGEAALLFLTGMCAYKIEGNGSFLRFK